MVKNIDKAKDNLADLKLKLNSFIVNGKKYMHISMSENKEAQRLICTGEIKHAYFMYTVGRIQGSYEVCCSLYECDGTEGARCQFAPSPSVTSS